LIHPDRAAAGDADDAHAARRTFWGGGRERARSRPRRVPHGTGPGAWAKAHRYGPPSIRRMTWGRPVPRGRLAGTASAALVWWRGKCEEPAVGGDARACNRNVVQRASVVGGMAPPRRRPSGVRHAQEEHVLSCAGAIAVNRTMTNADEVLPPPLESLARGATRGVSPSR
jgi:hypothetical protein